MSREGGNHDVSSVYVYNGVDEVPRDVTHIRVDPSVTTIPEGAFKGRESLVDIVLPEGLIRIEHDAFASCNLKRINLPSTVSEIGSHAFDNCTKLDGISLPEGLRSIGGWAFSHCCSLQRININPNLKIIGRAAFLSCESLTDISFSEGLQEIEKDAFSRCKSLVSVTLPSSLKDIGIESFEGCERLNKIHIPDTIENIHARAFKNCNFTNFRMPLSIGNALDISIVKYNSCFVSLELPESVEQLSLSLDDASSAGGLRNIALPSECRVTCLGRCTDLKLAFPENDYDDTIIDALKQRFDGLPIHKICYYQSYSDNETTTHSLRREINQCASKPPGQLNTTGKQQDCLGMTPLHILACSTKQTIEMYRLLIEKYPETLIMKDKWGDITLLYAIWCNAPTEILDLLVKSYKSLHPDYEFGWSGMIQTLAKRDAPYAKIEKLVDIQQSSFPDQKYDMEEVVVELAMYEGVQVGLGFMGHRRCTSIETFRYLLRISISKRLELLSIRRWHEELENRINAVSEKKSRKEDTQAVYDRLATYESIKEGTSVLELALWKAKIDESHIKRAKVDGDVSHKEQCRFNSGADIIIRNVLPYLLPK